MGANLKRLFNQYVIGPLRRIPFWLIFRSVRCRHAEEVSKNARLDVEAVQKVKYIHEFDR